MSTSRTSYVTTATFSFCLTGLLFLKISVGNVTLTFIIKTHFIHHTITTYAHSQLQIKLSQTTKPEKDKLPN